MCIRDRKDSVLDEDKPKLDLWSYTDTQIQPVQLKQLAQKKKQTYTAVYQIKDKTCIQIADTTIENIRPVSYTHLDVYKRQPYFRAICVAISISSSELQCNNSSSSIPILM